jgi:hypothetical protein
MKFKSYYELIQLKTFDERFDYLKIGGTVGEETFGLERYLNQIFIGLPNGSMFVEMR